MRELDKIIGYDAIKNELYRIIDVLKNPEKYDVLGVASPKGVLFSGNPGVGKTLLAKCIIEETGRKSYVIRKDKPDGEFVNHIRNVFEEAAKNAPSIILLDDMDKFSNSDSYHRDAEEYVTVQSCIDDVKDKDVFVVATTNDFNKLPDSLVRSGRFDRIYKLHFPQSKDAEKIIEHYLQNKKVAHDIDVEEIARFADGKTCAELETIVNEAGIYSGYEGFEKITQDNILKIILKEYVSETGIEASEQKIRRRAIHEAGHAVVTELLYPGAVTFAVIHNKESDVGGLIKRKGFEICTEQDYENRIMISLAGKAATEIVLQEADIGANSDLHFAFRYTTMLTDDFCRYGFETWCHGGETSQSVYDNLDRSTATEMARYYAEVKRLLHNNRAFLDAVIDQLISKHVLSYKDITVIRESLVA